MVVGIRTGLSVCLAVPSILVASSDVVSGVVVITDCEMECVSAGATLRGVVIVVVPSVGVTGILKDVLVCAVVDSEV